jgi:hypothetical protein
MIAVAHLFVAINLIPKKEKLMRLLLVIESSSPSAQLIIVSLNQIGTPEIASVSLNFLVLMISSYFYLLDEINISDLYDF